MPEGFKTKETKDTGKRCIYFPKAGEVYKTTYKKGTIKEFAKISESPLKVKPKVKVTVDTGDSDFIPIFFKPKAQYWDGDGYNTSTFNDAENYYESSWQSFRVDDEVIVQCYQNVPVAVVAFYDGIPRIGEALVKFTGKTVNTQKDVELYFDGAKQDFYMGNKGPDGGVLNLLKEAECIYQEQSMKTESYYFGFEGQPDFTPEWWMYDIDRCASSSNTSVISGSWEGGGINIGWNNQWITDLYLTLQLSTTIIVAFRYPKVKYEWTGRTHHYLCVVGPLLYVIQVLSVVEEASNPQFDGYARRNESDTVTGGVASYLVSSTYPPIPACPDGLYLSNYTLYNAAVDVFNGWANNMNATAQWQHDFTCANQTAAVNAMIEYQGCNDPYTPEGRVLLVEIAAAPYSKALYDSLKSGGHATHYSKQFLGMDPQQPFKNFYTPYSGLKRQGDWVKALDIGNEALLEGIATYQWQYQWNNRGVNTKFLTFKDGINMQTVKTYVRPHTKADIESLLGSKF